MIQDVEFNFIELPKFNKANTELASSIDQWTFFIKNAENLTVIPENVVDEGLINAYYEANKQNWTKQELEDYERASIKERDEIGRIELAQRRAGSKGEIIGILKVARKMFESGMPLEEIKKFTSMSDEELLQL